MRSAGAKSAPPPSSWVGLSRPSPQLAPNLPYIVQHSPTVALSCDGIPRIKLSSLPCSSDSVRAFRFDRKHLSASFKLWSKKSSLSPPDCSTATPLRSNKNNNYLQSGSVFDQRDLVAKREYTSNLQPAELVIVSCSRWKTGPKCEPQWLLRRN